MEVVLRGGASDSSLASDLREKARAVLSFETRDTRAVVLGGGTGMSTVVGGNSQNSDWPDHSSVGLKQAFPRLDVVVCTTDDGGSTGKLLRQLPMIGIGDLRKSCLSLILPERLGRTYGIEHDAIHGVLRLIQQVFNYRVPDADHGFRLLKDPLLAAGPGLRRACPKPLASALRSLGTYLSPSGRGPTIRPAGHCLGNLLLTAAVFRAAGGGTHRAPGLAAIRAGLDDIARLLGAVPSRLHAATATPGQLKFLYANGVEVYGQSKAGKARRGFPVERLTAEYARRPTTGKAVGQAIAEADLIVYAPGSLYTSMIPLLQLEPIVDAIRSNRKALKVLAANFWNQEGETDISPGHEGRGYLVSELVEAYDRNVPGGAQGLFHIVLASNLEHLPGDILRNYALEGKRPLRLDRSHVEAMGFRAVEAQLFSPDKIELSTVIQHDPESFALALRTLLYAREHPRWVTRDPRHRRPERRECGAVRRTQGLTFRRQRHRGLALCEYLASVKRALESKRFVPGLLKEVLVELAWENRDIHPSHLHFFEEARVIPARSWDRSTEWDEVSGYYDPGDRCLKLHERLMKEPERLKEDLLVALGESLLGRYIERRAWAQGAGVAHGSARCYEIRLRPVRARECLLNDKQLRRYLELARMIRDPANPLVYRLTINNNEGFLPSGLLFGLMYAWYLNNSYGGVMEYEMSLLRWPPRSLIPHQAKERFRKQVLVEFFREEVFGHAPDQRCLGVTRQSDLDRSSR